MWIRVKHFSAYQALGPLPHPPKTKPTNLTDAAPAADLAGGGVPGERPQPGSSSLGEWRPLRIEGPSLLQGLLPQGYHSASSLVTLHRPASSQALWAAQPRLAWLTLARAVSKPWQEAAGTIQKARVC